MDSDELLSQLLKEPPTAVEAWVHQAQAPPDLNWRGLAEAAASRALHDSGASRDARLAWARVSVIARGRLVDTAANRYERAGEARSVMNLRAELINRFGSEPGHPLLDCEEVVRWFLDRHEDPGFDAAVADAPHWRSLPVERIRDLREIKYELSVLRKLRDCAALESPDVQRWFTIRDQLP